MKLLFIISFFIALLFGLINGTYPCGKVLCGFGQLCRNINDENVFCVSKENLLKIKLENKQVIIKLNKENRKYMGIYKILIENTLETEIKELYIKSNYNQKYFDKSKNLIQLPNNILKITEPIPLKSKILIEFSIKSDKEPFLEIYAYKLLKNNN